MTMVAVYNPGGTTPLHYVRVTHAIGMIRRKVAVVREAVSGRKFGPYQYPRSMTLTRYVFERWIHGRRRLPASYTRDGLFRRDRGLCAYCGRVGSTVDHVVPRAHGGATSWLNCVVACRDCNAAKGSKSLAKSGLVLRFEPWVPMFGDLT